MLMPVVVFLVVVLIASARVKGPLWALSIAWLVSVLPVATGVLTFSYLQDRDYAYSLTIVAYLSCFVTGLATFYLLPRRASCLVARVAPPPVLPRSLPLAVWACWWLGMIGTVFVTADFYLLGGAGLSDLAALRETYVEKTSASIFAQLGSLMTWACLYCFIFALVFRQQLGWRKLTVLLLPIGGYFLISLFSAGRQAAFQVMLVTILTILTAAARDRLRQPRQLGVPRARRSGSGLLVAAVSTTMIAYMGYIAVARNDDAISDDKTEVLTALFDFKLSPTAQAVGAAVGQSLRAVAVEGLVYFSGSIGIFQQFLTIDFPDRSYGAMTLPVVFRQVQSLTGIAPADVLAARVASLNEIGVIGAGWTTAISSYLLDFGPTGTAVLLVLMGYYSGYAWRRALVGNHFEEIVIGIVVLLSALYMPLLPAVSDNNILFLWLFCVAVVQLRASRSGRSPAHVVQAAIAT